MGNTQISQYKNIQDKFDCWYSRFDLKFYPPPKKKISIRNSNEEGAIIYYRK